MSSPIAQRNEIDQRNELVVAHLPLVFHIARCRARAPQDLDDCVQAGVIGLIRAVEKYHAAKGPFGPYAGLWIRQAVDRHVWHGMQMSAYGQPIARLLRDIIGDAHERTALSLGAITAEVQARVSPLHGQVRPHTVQMLHAAMQGVLSMDHLHAMGWSGIAGAAPVTGHVIHRWITQLPPSHQEAVRRWYDIPTPIPSRRDGPAAVVAPPPTRRSVLDTLRLQAALDGAMPCVAPAPIVPLPPGCFPLEFPVLTLRRAQHPAPEDSQPDPRHRRRVGRGRTPSTPLSPPAAIAAMRRDDERRPHSDH